MKSYHNSFERLLNIVEELREKCPWDRKQTFDSLAPQTIEELYELMDAIRQKDDANITEELGDVLLHIVFYSLLGKEKNAFSIETVIEKICNKLVARHPHIYSSVKVKDEDEVKKNWENLKKSEGKKSIFSGIPTSLPAMNKAMAIQKKASNVGFDWNNPHDMLKKVKEEIAELEEEINKNNFDNIQNELGDVLFSVLNINRYYKFNEDETLNRCNEKFILRFQYIENVIESRNLHFQDVSLEEMEELWQKSKLNESKK